MKRIPILATLALAAAALIAGCGKKSETAQAGGDKELNLYAWSEYVPQEVIDQFTKETGIKVNYETYDSNEEMLSKLFSGASSYDLIQPSEYVIEALIKENKLTALDKSKLTNIGNLMPEFTTMGYDPGNKYSVPYMSGTVGICVNTDAVKDPVKGYGDVFNGTHKGRIVTLDDNREMVSWALADLGININDINPGTLAKAKPVLAKWIPQIKVFDSASPKTALLNGDVDLGIVWSGEAAIAYQENPKFNYVIPAEGAHIFIDNLAIPANAKHLEAALLFMNFILRPEISKIISDEFPYTNPNGAARKLLSPEQLNNPASYPKGSPKLEIFHDIGKSAADIDKVVTDLRSS
jgi:spermidine/putrescine transport system permease protein